MYNIDEQSQFLTSGRTIDSKTIHIQKDNGKLQIKKNLFKIYSEDVSLNIENNYMDKDSYTD